MEEQTRKNNLILIGMPGSGKSTLGVLLAKHLGMSFCDTDLLLQCQTGMRLADLLAARGKAAFIEAEGELLARWTGECTVVATGGSAVYSEAGMRNLKRLGWTLYLEVPSVEIMRRIGRADGRGIAAHPGQPLNALLEERRPLYERYADHVVRWSEGQTMEDMVMAIAGIAKRHVEVGCMTAESSDV